MKSLFPAFAAVVALGFAALPARSQAGTCNGLSLGPEASLNGFIPFPRFPVRGSSITLTPASTTTLTLYSTNQYGRSTAKVTVKVN